jgi:hypothetical protein
MIIPRFEIGKIYSPEAVAEGVHLVCDALSLSGFQRVSVALISFIPFSGV